MYMYITALTLSQKERAQVLHIKLLWLLLSKAAHMMGILVKSMFSYYSYKHVSLLCYSGNPTGPGPELALNDMCMVTGSYCCMLYRGDI